MKTTQIDATCPKCGVRNFTLQALSYVQIWHCKGDAVTPARRIIETVCNNCGHGTLLKFRVDEMDDEQFQAVIKEVLEGKLVVKQITDESES
jgi:DNA-directed RNA polymerase subunit RPC12/RpoP